VVTQQRPAASGWTTTTDGRTNLTAAFGARFKSKHGFGFGVHFDAHGGQETFLRLRAGDDFSTGIAKSRLDTIVSYKSTERPRAVG
jgi:hypothetical protein